MSAVQPRRHTCITVYAHPRTQPQRLSTGLFLSDHASAPAKIGFVGEMLISAFDPSRKIKFGRRTLPSVLEAL